MSYKAWGLQDDIAGEALNAEWRALLAQLQALGTDGLAWPPAAAQRLRQMAAVYDVLHANLAAARWRLADLGQPLDP